MSTDRAVDATATTNSATCPYCGAWRMVYDSPHTVFTCPKVRAVEFFENGTIKRVEMVRRD